LRWAGGFRTLGKEDSLRFVGAVRGGSVNADGEYPVSFNSDLYLTRAAPSVQYSTNPLRHANESVDRSLDSARVIADGKVAHGPGKLLVFDSILFEGMFCDGYRHGQGRGVIFADADGREGTTFLGVYVGNWRYGCRNGRGLMTTPDGVAFDGLWVDDKPNGVALVRFPDGSTLLGTFNENMRVPRGGAVFTWSDGCKEYHLYSSDGRLERHRVMTASEAAAVESRLRVSLDVPATVVGSPSIGNIPMQNIQRTDGVTAAGGSGAAVSAYLPQPITSPAVGSTSNLHPSDVPLSLLLKTRLRDFSKNDCLQISARLSELGVGNIEVKANDDSFIARKESNGGTGVNMLVDPSIVSGPLIEAIRNVATDDMSKMAISAAIKTIVVTNDDQAPGASFNIAQNTLTITMPLTRGGNTKLDALKLAKFLESSL